MEKQSIDPIIDDVLRLLVYVITADDKVYQEEIDSFLRVSSELELSDDNSLILERDWLFDWFLQNYEAVKAANVRADVDTKIVHLFIRLKAWPNKKQLLDATRTIAASDGDYHLNEKVVIALAAAYWDMKSPAME